MIELKNKPNVVAPGGDFPYGRIKDKAGPAQGTPVNVVVYGDQHQFFEKLINESGISPNGLPDNATNGFQLFEALKTLTGLNVWTNGTTPVITENGTPLSLTSTYSRYRIVGKTLYWQFAAAFSTATNAVLLKIALPKTGISLKTGQPQFMGITKTEVAVLTIKSNEIEITRLTGQPFLTSGNPYNIQFHAVIELV